MKTENRFLLILIPKQGIKEWLKKISMREKILPAAIEALDIEPLQANSSAYLLPREIATLEDAAQYFQQNYQLFFDHELSRINEDKRLWPENKSLETFTKWYDVRFHSKITIL